MVAARRAAPGKPGTAVDGTLERKADADRLLEEREADVGAVTLFRVLAKTRARASPSAAAPTLGFLQPGALVRAGFGGPLGISRWVRLAGEGGYVLTEFEDGEPSLALATEGG